MCFQKPMPMFSAVSYVILFTLYTLGRDYIQFKNKENYNININMPYRPIWFWFSFVIIFYGTFVYNNESH